MNANANESLILSSDDDQLTLTTLRIIQKNKGGSKEINLKDYVSFEIIQKKSMYWLILSILFAALDIYLLMKALNNDYDVTNETTKGLIFVLVFFLGLTLVPLFLWYRNTKKYVKLIGKYNYIEFLAQRMKQASIDKLINNINSAKEKTESN